MLKQVTLDPGQSTEVTFIVSPNEAGIYQATLDSLSASFEALFRLETIVDPQLDFRALSLPYGLEDFDCFAGAELSAYIGGYFRVQAIGGSRTIRNEFSLIKGSVVTPLGSGSLHIVDRYDEHVYRISGASNYITLPDSPGTYETMLRMYIDEVLTSQHPYLGPITIVPKGVSHFSYSRPSLTVRWDSWWPGYTYSVTGTITNTGSVSETKKVVLWLRKLYHDFLDSSGGVTGDGLSSNRWYRKHEFTLTLAPGESYSYSHLPKHDVSDPGWDRVPIAGGESLLAQLRDSDGGVSEKSYTRKAT